MSAIEGYTFVIDMQDRATAGFQRIKNEARTMKNVMRATFDEIKMGEGTFASLNYKIQETDRVIQGYQEAIKRAKSDMADLLKEQDKNGQMNDATAKKYLRLQNTVTSFQRQIGRLKADQESARESLARYNTGLDQLRDKTESVKNVMNSYVNELKSEGRAFATTRAEQQSYRLQKQALANQYRAEVTETSRLRSQLTSLNSKYAEQKGKVSSALSAHGRMSSVYQEEKGKLEGLVEQINKTNSQFAKTSSAALRTRTSINEMSRAASSVNDGGITRLSRAMNNVSANAQRATSHTRAWAQSLRGDFIAATFAVAPLGAAMGKSVQMAASLQQSWVNTSNILRTGATSAREARSEVSKVSTMQRDATKYSKQYGFSQKEIAEQYTELVKRGYNANQSIGSMKSMLEAARASGDDYADVVKNVSSTLDAFNLRQNKSTKQVIANSKRVTNAMAYAADMTATDFKGMGEAMSYVSASAHQAGQSVETTTAAVGELSNAGIEGTRAGTGMRKVMNSLLAPTAGATEALNKYGMSMDDFKTKSGALKQLPDIMKVINKHTKDLGKADRGAFFKAVFGTTGQQAAMVLAQNSKAMAELVKNEKEAEKNNYVNDLAKRNMQSTQMQMKQLQMNVQTIAINMGNKLLPAVNAVAGAFSRWVGSKDGQKALEDFSDSVVGLANGISKHSGAIFNFLGGLTTGFLDVFKVAGKVAGALGNVTAAIFKLPGMKGEGNKFAKYIGESTGAILGFIAVFKLVKTTINGMSAVRQDIKSMFHLDGISKEESQLTTENNELKENIDLWKQHNEVSNGGSSLGSDITHSTSSKEGKGSSKSGPNVDVATNVEKQTGSRMERVGAKSAGFFSHGFGKGLRVAGRFGADTLIQTFTMGILDWDITKAIGSKLLAPFKMLGRAIKKIDYFPDGRVASTKGVEAGANYARGVERGTKANKKFSFRNWFKGSSYEGKHAGTQAGKSFSESITKSVEKDSKSVSAKEIFQNTAKEAGEAGSKTGRSFVSRLGFTLKRTKTIPEVGKSLGGRLGGAATVAFGAVDLFKAVGSSNSHNQARKVGQSLGNTAGAAGGAAIGASLGSVVPGIGTAIGGILGGTIGGIAGGKIGKSIGKAWPQIKKGASETAKFMGKAFQAPFKWVYDQGRKFGNWLNKQLGHSGKRTKDNTMGSGNYSAKDRKLVQQMTAAVRSYTRALERLKKTKMEGYFKRLANEIKKSKITKELSSLDKSTRNSAKNWRSLAKPLKQSASAFKTLQKSIRGLSGKKNGFTQITKDVRDLYRTIRKNPFGKLISQQANIANKSMSGKKSGFVSVFDRNVRSMERALRSFRRTFDRDWKETWRGLDRPVSREMSSVYREVRRYLDDVDDKRASFSKSFLKGWGNWIDDVVSEFRKGFSKLPGYAASSMKDIISRLNKGISGINSTISSFGGDKKLSSISYANGTNFGGHPGGHMLVNDSKRQHWKELVLFPNGQAMLPQKRNTLIPNAPQGTQVLSGESTYKFMNAIGVHKYADGTLSDSEMDKLSEEFEKHPQQAAKTLVLKLTNWNSKIPVVADLGKASAIAFSKGIANVLKDLLGAVKNPVNGDWTPVIRSAAAKMGVSITAYDIKRILNTIAHESGGNQRIPGIDDHDGTGRALGLLQYKRSTFNSYAVAGHHDIFSGYDQLLALFNDSNWRGDLRWSGGWGPSGGRRFANGGFVGVHGLYEMAEGNKLESIIPLDLNKRPRALQVVNQTLDRMENDGGGTGNIKRINPTDDNKFQNNVIALLGQIAGLNQQQIKAILSIGNSGNDMRSRRIRSRFYSDYGNDQRISDYMSY